MTELIQENKFEELKEVLKNSEEFQIHQFLFNILEGKAVEINDESFSPDRYQIEFLEGVKIYKNLEKSEIDPEQLRKFSNLLVHLSFIMSSYMHVLAEDAMNQGTYLTDPGHEYKVYPEIRATIQELIDLLSHQRDEGKAIANLSSAKAKVSNSIGNLLEKYEIGEDMLQFAKHFEAVGEIEIAIRIHQGIMNDFECDSVKLSSGLFPEMSHVDDRPETEIEIFHTAKINYEKLTGHEIEEPNRIHIKDSPAAENLSKTNSFQSTEMPTTKEQEKTSDQEAVTAKNSVEIRPSLSENIQNTVSKPGFLEKIKRMFRKN